MFLTGAVGSRKTSFAAAILKRWLVVWKEWGIFVPAYEAASRLRNLDKIAETVKKWSETPLLVLDDIGANRSTPHIIEQLLFLIQRRYDWERATIITSNLSLKKFSQRIDDPANPRAGSRIETGMVLDLGSTDYRMDAEKPEK